MALVGHESKQRLHAPHPSSAGRSFTTSGASVTTLPVIGVPVPLAKLDGLDSLLSIVQMPAGIPVATFAIGEAGATNAALFAIHMLSHEETQLRTALVEYRRTRHDEAVSSVLPPA